MITGKVLIDTGWPNGPLIGQALRTAEAMAKDGLDEKAVLAALDRVRTDPETIGEDDPCYPLVKAWRALHAPPQVRDVPLDAPIWGAEIIDPQAIRQLHNAMRLPVTVGGALMPDAHVGYGIPIGGVVALENAVAPYMVGVDIACRMMMSIFPKPSDVMLTNASKNDKVRKVMREETRFGLGAKFGKYERRSHDVLDDPDWNATPQLRHLKDKACAQLGTSGTGNHFVDAGLLRVGEEGRETLGIEPGTYFAVMTHSGSRGVGATLANFYSRLAQQRANLPRELRHLAWLSLDSEAGQEYWISMNLAGRFASACHHTIHRAIAKRLSLKPVVQVENHHNFAWKETWHGKEVYVHRKGATPAHRGVLGIIPGSQGHDSFIVRGLGSEASINSASHGAGRQMSRKKAKQSIPKKARDAWLKERGVELLGSGMDEAPQAYKNIREVLALQRDLVEPIATFQPRLVLMASDGKTEG
ncbi:MAG: RtcB family protein [Rhodothermales bacterium]